MSEPFKRLNLANQHKFYCPEKTESASRKTLQSLLNEAKSRRDAWLCIFHQMSAAIKQVDFNLMGLIKIDKKIDNLETKIFSDYLLTIKSPKQAIHAHVEAYFLASKYADHCIALNLALKGAK